MSKKTFTQEEINEITNTLYAQYIEFVRADKMDYKDLILVENVILKIQMTVEDKVNENE